MKISKLARAHDGECFSSWVYRMHVKKIHLSTYELLDPLPDPDFDPPDTICSSLCSGDDKNCQVIKLFFRAPSLWLLPWEKRVIFCSSCLREDIARGGLPYWRQSWCLLHAPVCSVHCQLLSVYKAAYLASDKAWLAFSADCNYPQEVAFRNRAIKPRDARGFNYNAPKAMLVLALRVQRFLSASLKSSSIWLPSIRRHTETDWLILFANYLFEDFLFPRSHSQGTPGLARGHQFGLPRDVFHSADEAKLAALQEFDPYARVIALILIGRVFGLINGAEIKKVVNQMYVPAILFECSPEDIARNGLRSSRSDRLALEQILYQAPTAARGITEAFHIKY